eukprot:8325347-Pyramimonas_sp.AAC.1
MSCVPKSLSTRLITPPTCPLRPAVFKPPKCLGNMGINSEPLVPQAPRVSRLTSISGPHPAGLAASA